MNRPHLTFFVKLMQRWCSVVILTSRRRCGLEVMVSTLYRCCHYNIHDILWGELTSQLWDNVSTRLQIWRRSIDFLKTLWIWRYDINVTATFSIQHPYCELNLLSNVEATLEERWNFDVVASVLLQRCVLVVQCYDLTTTLSQRCVFDTKLLAFAIFSPGGLQILILKNR